MARCRILEGPFVAIIGVMGGVPFVADSEELEPGFLDFPTEGTFHSSH